MTTAIPIEPPPEVEDGYDPVRGAQRGDPDAFDRLYLAHVDRVYAICLRMSADPVRARELTQDVFVRVWQRLATFRGESRLSTWLYRLAANVVIESFRAERRGTRRLEVQLEAQGALFPSTAFPPTTGAAIDVEKALTTLPAGARSMLVLHAIEGYRYEEIASMTGTALGTVKAQIHRARRLLREALDDV